MAIADWIREATARKRERLIQQAIQQGYEQGYADAQQGKPKQPPCDDPGKSTQGLFILSSFPRRRESI